MRLGSPFGGRNLAPLPTHVCVSTAHSLRRFRRLLLLLLLRRRWFLYRRRLYWRLLNCWQRATGIAVGEIDQHPIRPRQRFPFRAEHIIQFTACPGFTLSGPSPVLVPCGHPPNLMSNDIATISVVVPADQASNVLRNSQRLPSSVSVLWSGWGTFNDRGWQLVRGGRRIRSGDDQDSRRRLRIARSVSGVAISCSPATLPIVPPPRRTPCRASGAKPLTGALLTSHWEASLRLITGPASAGLFSGPRAPSLDGLPFASCASRIARSCLIRSRNAASAARYSAIASRPSRTCRARRSSRSSRPAAACEQAWPERVTSFYPFQAKPPCGRFGSRKKPLFAPRGARRAYLGRMLGSPPGLPGGGMTGVRPASGVGALISGSTSGGHSTPSVRASFSLSSSPGRLLGPWPLVSGTLGAGWPGCRRSPGLGLVVGRGALLSPDESRAQQRSDQGDGSRQSDCPSHGRTTVPPIRSSTRREKDGPG